MSTNPVFPARKAACDGDLLGPVPINYANPVGSGGTKRFDFANFYILLTFAGAPNPDRTVRQSGIGRACPGAWDPGKGRVRRLGSVRRLLTLHESVESRRVALVEALTQAGELGTGGTVDENEIENVARR